MRSAAMITVAAVLCAGALTAAHADAGEVGLNDLWVTNLGVSGANVAEAHLSDLDGDGVREALVTIGRAREFSTVVAIELLDGAEVWRAEHVGAVSVLAADILPRRGEEVVTCFGTTILVQAGATGETLAKCELSGAIRDVGIAQDVSGEQLIMLMVRGDGRDDLVALGLPGMVERWRRSTQHDGSPFGDGLSKLRCVDIDGDGSSEILVVENANILTCISSAGADLWNLKLGEKSRLNPEGVASNLPVVADLTGDGYNEIAVGCFAGAVVVLDGETGEELTRMLFGNESHVDVLAKRRLPRFIRDAIARTGEPIGEMVSVDVDGAGGSELIFGCSDGVLYAAAPTRKGRVWELDLDGDVYDAPVPVVLKPTGPNGSAVSCVVAWHERRVGILASETGEEVLALPGGTGASDVLVCDVTGDGRDDLVVVSARSQSIEAIEFRFPADE